MDFITIYIQHGFQSRADDWPDGQHLHVWYCMHDVRFYNGCIMSYLQSVTQDKFHFSLIDKSNKDQNTITFF